MSRWLLLATIAASLWADEVPFRLDKTGEVVVSVNARAANTDWEQAGKEAAILDISVDQGPTQQLVLYAGPANHTYRFFVGELPAGAHKLQFKTNTQFTAPGAGAVSASQWQFQTIAPNAPEFAAVAHAPILFARKNTVGRFTDVPLLVFCEQTMENRQQMLQYTVIFSNEDGGTSTRALMARWGRTTDIEYVYRAYLTPGGEVEKAIIQGRNHQDIEFRGQREGHHPMLLPVTDNNMVAGVNSPADMTPLRYQLAPQLVDLSQHAREQVLDDNPVLYQVAAKEMVREGKLRPYNVVDGEKISDLRNYLTIELKHRPQNAALSVLVRRKNGPWQSGSLGRPDYAISRPGWVRTTVELPAGTQASDLDEIGFECIAVPMDIRQPLPLAGTCQLDAVSKVFLLKSDGLPGPSFWRLRTPVTIPTGQIMTYPLP